MKKEDHLQCALPPKRTGAYLKWIASVSMARIAICGVFTYAGLVFLASTIEYVASRTPSHSWVRSGEAPVGDFRDILYFNSVTILTIGYGDYVPNGAGARALSVAEAFLGTCVIATTISALIAKFLSPPTNSIVFSQYAYYCTEKEQFLIVYLNTTKNNAVNADHSAYFKIAGDWTIAVPQRSPLITQSVQTFYIVPLKKEDLIAELNIDRPEDSRDLLRVGISGQIGSGSFSVAIQYDVSEIIVLPNRDKLKAYRGFWEVDLKDPEFQKMFHYRPVESPTLIEYVRIHRDRLCKPDLYVESPN